MTDRLIAAPEGVLLTAPTTDEALDLADRAVQWLVTSGPRIILILVVASVLSAVASWLLRRVARTMVQSSSRITEVAGVVVRRDARSLKAAQARREQRARTLSTVARNVATLVIWAVAIVMVLSELGVNVAPVIASLGVLGLAAGIGAQTIIKDVVAGMVMLFEDIAAVGDVVDLEFATGTVENINLRATQLRSLDGVLWTVRNGEIVRIGNMSRGHAKAVIVLDIDAGADDAVVTRVLEEVSGALTTDPDWIDVVQGDADISGMLDVDGNRYQRRVIVTTAPAKQWEVEQELRGRIRAGFAAADISFAHPRFVDAAQQA